MRIVYKYIKIFLLLSIFVFVNNLNAARLEKNSKKIIKIGILAKRGYKTCLQRWVPTAQYLTSQIEGAKFKIVPLKFEDVVNAVSKKKIDFVLANPSYYVELEYNFGVSRILTIVNLFNGIPYTEFGGAIFYKKGKEVFNSYNDLIGKSVIAVEEHSFGGWQVCLHEFMENGINPKSDFKTLQFAGTHDSVVYAIKNGIADIGCVRTGILERMGQAGKIKIENYKVLPLHKKENCKIPFLHSTPTYPEWPLAKLEHVSEEFAKKVAVVLLELDKNSKQAKQAKIFGWTVPQNYQSVHECLKDLNLGPYKNLGKFNLLDVLNQYKIWIFIFFILISFLLFSFFRVAILNKKLKYSKENLSVELNGKIKAQKALEEINENLENLVKNRTIQLEKTNSALLEKIKEHKLVADALLAEKEFSEKIIDASNAVIVGLDKDHLIQIFNKGAELVTGYTKEEVLGKDWFKIFFSEDLLNEMNLVWKEAWGVKKHVYENSILTKSKEERIISWVNTGLYEDANLSKHLLISIGVDITERKKAEATLRESEEKFRKIFYTTPDAITISRVSDGLYVDVNEGFTHITGYSRADAIGKTAFDLNIWMNKKERQLFIDELRKNGRVSNLKIKSRTKSGKFYVGLISAELIELFGSLHLISIGRDISVLEEARIKLKESEERYSRLSNLTYEGIIIHKNGFTLDINSSFEKISGYSKEELVGKDLVQLFIPKKHYPIVYKMMKETVTVPYEIEGIRKDGSILQIELESRNIDYANEKNARVTAVRDISKRKQMEAELRRSENLSKFITESAADAIVSFDENSIVVLWNKAAEKIFGYSSDEMINKNITQIIPARFQEKHKKGIIQLKDIEKEKLIGKRIELMALKKDGTEIPIELSLAAWSVDNETFFTGILRDVTERKNIEKTILEAKEKAENADKMKSVFLAQMSHEIRTPINALVNMASLLRFDFEEIANEEQLISFDVIDRAGERIIRTIDLLLNLSEIQTGTYEVLPTKFDIVSDVISVLLVENKKLANKKNIELKLETSTDDTELVADSYTVNQIFTQLIDNAIKYTEKGEVTISIFRNKLEQLVVEVKDTGIGIEDTYLPNLFNPFSQEEMGYTRKFEGNGIGLTLVSKYCELNNAKIEVETQKGVGSTFRVIF